MSLTDAVRRLRFGAKRSSRVLDRADEQVRSLALRVQPTRRAALRAELGACTTPVETLRFAERYLGASQKAAEILEFVSFVRHVAPERLCEIGTLGGGTHFLIARLVDSLRETLAVDLVVRNKAKLELLARPGQQLHCIEGSSYAPATLSRVAAALNGRQVDVLFIDGDHRYAGVRADFLAYRRFVREGGLIAFHDICEDYETRFGQATGAYAGDVPRFWRTLRQAYDYREFVESPEQDGFGIGVIVYSSATPLPVEL